MQRPIKQIKVNYVSQTGEALSFERHISKNTPRIRTRLCGGVGGQFRIYLDREDGGLQTLSIPQSLITSVTTIMESK